MKADQKVEAPAGGGSKKLIIIIVAVVLLLAAAGGGAAWFFMHGKEDAHEEEDKPVKKKSAKKAGPSEYIPVEPFTVNLQPGESGVSDQYLQLAFTLEVSSLEEADNVKKNMAKVRNRVLLLLSSKKAADINTPEGKVQLSKEITEQLSEPFEHRGDKQDIIDVLFTSFIIQ